MKNLMNTAVKAILILSNYMYVQKIIKPPLCFGVQIYYIKS